MKPGIKGVILFTVASFTLLLAQSVQATQARPFLKSLNGKIEEKLGDTNLTTAQRKALTTAQKALRRESKTVSTDLSAFVKAWTPLKKQFGSDTEITRLASAVADYSGDLWWDIQGALNQLGTNELTKAQSNRLVRATNALNRADALTNPVARARATIPAANKLFPLFRQMLGSNAAPATIVHPGVEAVLTEDAPNPTETTQFFLHSIFSEENPTGYLHFQSDKPEEVGLWSYERTGPDTGVIHLQVTYGDPYPPFDHDLTLNFETPRRGTFKGVNGATNQISGWFFVY
jgi:hypothetical protein